MKTLLVCVDFSDVTDELFVQAEKLATVFKEKIVLLHVVEPEPDFVGFDAGPEVVRVQWARTFHNEHKKLEQMQADLAKTNLKVSSLLVQGPVAEEILKHAKSLHADMVLMGTHGHGQLYNLLAGSVAQGVLKKAFIPVMLVPIKKK